MPFAELYRPDDLVVYGATTALMRPLFEGMKLLPEGDEEVLDLALDFLSGEVEEVERIVHRLGATAHTSFHLTSRSVTLTALAGDLEVGAHFEAVLKPDPTSYGVLLDAGWGLETLRRSVEWPKMFELLRLMRLPIPDNPDGLVVPPEEMGGDAVVARYQRSDAFDILFHCVRVR